MWYVNTTQKEGDNMNLTGFILTMWYVNEAFSNVDLSDLMGFILTMWYVNWSMFLTNIFSNSVLY